MRLLFVGGSKGWKGVGRDRQGIAGWVPLLSLPTPEAGKLQKLHEKCLNDWQAVLVKEVKHLACLVSYMINLTHQCASFPLGAETESRSATGALGGLLQ